jgi:hypothetical protein
LGGGRALAPELWVRSDLSASNVVTSGAWSCVDVDLNQASNGGASVSVDGNSIATMTGDFGGAATYSRVVFWASYIDDVSVASN